jgi:hypothetical protein
VEASPLTNRQFRYWRPGSGEPMRVTTDANLFDEHPENTELWSPGSPAFPELEDAASADEVLANRAALKSMFPTANANT